MFFAKCSEIQCCLFLISENQAWSDCGIQDSHTSTHLGFFPFCFLILCSSSDTLTLWWGDAFCHIHVFPCSMLTAYSGRPHPWRYLKDMEMWHLETRFSGGLGSVRFQVGVDDLKRTFPIQIYGFLWNTHGISQTVGMLVKSGLCWFKFWPLWLQVYLLGSDKEE